MSTLRTLAVLVCLFAGCDSETPAQPSVPDTSEPRGPLGKSDAIGSCFDAGGDPICDGQSDGSCWCDDACVVYGDCCEDRSVACEEAATICESSDDCWDTEFCDDNGQCGGEGVCIARPDYCTREYNPVCGCDGNTYSNPCMAAFAGASIAAPGACEDF